jgi:predicted nuclease of predicted toxin-antitoxin system
MLAEAGHDVLFSVDNFAGAPDRDIVALAHSSGRVLVTLDFDFGELAVRQGIAVPGVLLLGGETLLKPEGMSRIVGLLSDANLALEGCLTRIDAKRVRQRRLD